MLWRSQGMTGSNNIQLGNRRRYGGDDGGAQDAGYVPSPSSDGMADSSYKRGRSPARGICPVTQTCRALLLTH
jgi:splicing factor 1